MWRIKCGIGTQHNYHQSIGRRWKKISIVVTSKRSSKLNVEKKNFHENIVSHKRSEQGPARF